MNNNVSIIGADGVGSVVVHKCAQNNDVLGDIYIASRTLEKCEAIMDVNAGDHGKYFPTNFDPEINLREIQEDVGYWDVKKMVNVEELDPDPFLQLGLPTSTKEEAC